MMRLSAAILSGAALLLAAQAADNPFGSVTKGMSDPNAPIEVSADNFIADANARTGVYSGNVVVHQGDLRIRANTMRVHVAQNKPDKIVVQGGVVVDAPSGIATGDNGVYDVGPRIITLTGHVVLTRDKNVMRGQQLTVNLVTGQAVLDGKGTGTTGRVQALFAPNGQNDGKH